MAPGSGVNVDIRTIIGSIVNFVKSKANAVCTAPCDGLVLRMHYRWTFFVFVGGFFTVWYSWYHRDVITCVSHHNADTQVRLDYINICLSYPYIENEEGPRRYLLFYRWVHWSFLLLAGVYYIPRKLSKGWDNLKVKKLLEELAQHSYRYDNSEKELLDRAFRYVSFNMKTHNGLYWKYLAANFVALLIDIGAMQFVDFLLQGKFIRYGFAAYPFERDPKDFTDYMSVMFPPFATCQLAPKNMLVAKRTETLGCHLTLMELYEKLFLGLWLWLIIITFLTALYIIFLLLIFLPPFRQYLLRCEKPVNAHGKVSEIINALSRTCKIGDVYLLYRIRSHLSHVRFYELMTQLANPQQLEMQPNHRTPNEKQKHMMQQQQQQQKQQPQPENLRHRRGPPQNQLSNQPEPPINPAYLEQLLSNPEMGVNKRQPPAQIKDVQQRTPLLDKNSGTSILIE